MCQTVLLSKISMFDVFPFSSPIVLHQCLHTIHRSPFVAVVTDWEPQKFQNNPFRGSWQVFQL